MNVSPTEPGEIDNRLNALLKQESPYSDSDVQQLRFLWAHSGNAASRRHILGMAQVRSSLELIGSLRTFDKGSTALVKETNTLTARVFWLTIVTILIGIVNLASVFIVEYHRRSVESAQLALVRQGVLDAEAHSAWRTATRYDTFYVGLMNSRQEPKQSPNLNERSVWVKSFQRADIQSLGRSQKYGNSAYRLKTMIEFHDTPSMNLIEVAASHGAPSNVIVAAMQGESHLLTMECKVEQLDGGEWVADEYKFSPTTTRLDYPFEKVKGN